MVATATTDAAGALQPENRAIPRRISSMESGAMTSLL